MPHMNTWDYEWHDCTSQETLTSHDILHVPTEVAAYYISLAQETSPVNSQYMLYNLLPLETYILDECRALWGEPEQAETNHSSDQAV